MMHPPRETAKLVGIKWQPSPEFAHDVLEPHIDPAVYAALKRREGHVALRSVMMSGFDTKPVAVAKRFDRDIEREWDATSNGLKVTRKDARAPIHEVHAAYSRFSDSFRFKFGIVGVHAALQRTVLEKMMLDAPGDFVAGDTTQAVYLDIRTSAIADGGDKKSILDSTLRSMRQQLGDRDTKHDYWLTNPRIHVVPYENTEAAILVQKLAARGIIDSPN